MTEINVHIINEYGRVIDVRKAKYVKFEWYAARDGLPLEEFSLPHEDIKKIIAEEVERDG